MSLKRIYSHFARRFHPNPLFLLTVALLAFSLLSACASKQPNIKCPDCICPETHCADGTRGNAEIVESMEKNALLSLMQEWGYEVRTEPNRDNVIIWQLSKNMVAIVFIAANQKSLQFFFGMEANKNQISLTKINRWNKEKRYSRFYRRNDDSVALELDLDLEGGVTERAVKEFFQTCIATVIAWSKEHFGEEV